MPGERAGKADRLDAEFGMNQRVARRRGVAFIEHQVERRAHRFGALRQSLGRRRFDGDARLLELAARPHQALGDGGRLRQQPGRDLRDGEAAHCLQGKSDARLDRQRGMADGKQQHQLVVVQFTIEAAALFWDRRSRQRQLLGEGKPAHLVAQQVEGAVPGDDGEPGFGLGRHALERPVGQRLQQRVLHGILGDGDAAGTQPPRQGGDQAARRIAGQRIDEPVNARVHGQPAAAARTCVMSSIGRISIQFAAASVRCGHSRAMASASAASFTWMTK